MIELLRYLRKQYGNHISNERLLRAGLLQYLLLPARYRFCAGT
jgi:hypothetical protein